jgi:hypothetical protein
MVPAQILPTGGVLITDFTLSALASDQVLCQISQGVGDSANEIRLFVKADGTLSLKVVEATVLQTEIDSAPAFIATGVRHRVAFSYLPANFSVAMDGSPVGSSLVGLLPVNMDSLVVGEFNGTPITGRIAVVGYLDYNDTLAATLNRLSTKPT